MFEFNKIEFMSIEEVEEELNFLTKFIDLYNNQSDKNRMLELQVYLENKKYIKIKKDKDDERLTKEDW